MDDQMVRAYTCENLLLFGGLPAAYLAEWAITSDLALAESKLDVKFDIVPQDALLARYASLDADAVKVASRLAEDLVHSASPGLKRTMPPAPPHDEIVKAARLYVAMQQFVEERDGHAVTIGCGPWILGEGLPAPCVALMFFQEQGIPAACQGDIDALLTMVLFRRVSGWSSFMGGAIKAHGQLGINHCVICRNLAGPDIPSQAYTLSNYHGRKDTPTVWAKVPTGEIVTVARLTQNLERLLLFKGPIIANQTHNTRCRNTLIVQVPDRDRVFKAVKGHQNHYVVAYGDRTRALTALAEARDIEVVRLDILSI